MFLLYIFLIWGSVLAHVAMRTQNLWRLKGRVRLFASLVFLLLGFGYIPARAFLHNYPDSAVGPVLTYTTALIMGYIALLWTLLLMIELFAGLAWLVARYRLRQLPLKEARRFAAAWWGVAGALIVLAVISAQGTPRVNRMEMSIPGASPARFAVISDLHLGANTSRDLWKRTLETVEAQRPDALFIAGDLIDDRSADTRALVSLIRDYFPVEPVYVVTGNHERYTGLDYFAELCNELGFRWLRREVQTLTPGLSIGGIDDARGEALAGPTAELLSRAQGPLIMLAHRPETAHLVQHRPETLVLSGHTHGGQIPPMIFLVALGNGGFSSGHYNVGEANLYVSAGAGLWGPPMRLLAPAEIVVIDVRAGEKFEVEMCL